MSRVETTINALTMRSLSATLGNVLMLAVAIALAPHAGTFSQTLVLSLFGALLGVRIYVRRAALARPDRRSFAMLACGVLACNLLWGLIIANVESAGVGLPAVVYAFFCCGIATASVSSFASSSLLQRTALLALLAPGIIVAISGSGVPAFGLLHAIFLAHTLVAGKVVTREFWQTVAANDKLRHEIAQRLAIEIELRQAHKLEAVGRLAAGIAHEINTPVQFVTDSCTFLADGIGNLQAGLDEYRALVIELAAQSASPAAITARVTALEETHDLAYMREHLDDAAQRSLAGLERVANIVRATKEFASPRNGVRAPANLNAAIESTLVICGHETFGVADIVTELGALPLVTCSSGELNQVFLNIIVNAAHAIAEKREHGTITIKTWAPGDGWVKIAISDTGSGIPAEIVDKIFEPFFTTKPVGKGSGQGLAVARSIVVGKHGGMLDVASQLGIGTTFTIALPA